MADQSVSEEQKQALVRIYLSFRREYEDERENGQRNAHEPGGEDPGPPQQAAQAASTPPPAASEPSGPAERVPSA
jgi:hypothetical protein